MTAAAATGVRIALINPNTTASMTATMAACAQAVAAPGTVIEPITSRMGPVSIESHYDEALAVPGLLEAVGQAERDGATGHVLACFGDPGLDAARELAAGPVVGIAEAAMHTAVLLGRSFSVVTTLSRTIGRAQDLVQRYGMTGHCRSIRAAEIPVLDLEIPGSAARDLVSAECLRALDEDGCEVIVLGCAGMADFGADLSRNLGVPVVDGVTAAVKLVEGLLAQGLRTSTRLEYAHPPPKPYVGLLAGFGRRDEPAPSTFDVAVRHAGATSPR